jgi:hypothetical protein
MSDDYIARLRQLPASSRHSSVVVANGGKHCTMARPSGRNIGETR